jgi:hypothetical protein
VAGTGGAIALLLAARRQRSTEQTLEHQREVAVEQRTPRRSAKPKSTAATLIDQLGPEASTPSEKNVVAEALASRFDLARAKQLATEAEQQSTDVVEKIEDLRQEHPRGC